MGQTIKRLTEIKELTGKEQIPVGTKDQYGNDENKRISVSAFDMSRYPKWFRDALVCWYDVERQGCTNENMKANPILKDFSANHLDMQLHNFAWKGMSGIGGYALDFNLFRAQFPNTTEIVSKTQYKIVFKKTQEGDSGVLQKGGFANSFKVKVEIPSGAILMYEDIQGPLFSIKESGTYILPNAREGSDYSYFKPTKNGVLGEFSIEQLPLYPNALVFDGQDDYGISENQPILTDYSVFSRRKPLRDYKIGGDVFASKMNTRFREGAFLLDRGDGARRTAWSFGGVNEIQKKDYNTSWIIATKYSYNNHFYGSVGNEKDTDILTLGSLDKNGTLPYKGVFYNFILFNRTLTPSEIDWVKGNIMFDKSDAPIDGQKYLRQDGKWIPITADGGVMRPLFEAAGAVFNEQTGFYELNGLTDITEEEMADIYANGLIISEDCAGYFANTKIRTNISRKTSYWSYFRVFLLDRAFRENPNLETIYIKTSPSPALRPIIKSWYSAFYNCTKLKKIDVGFNLDKDLRTSVDDFKNCASLEDVEFYKLASNIDFRDSPLFSKRSLKLMIDNSAATSPITITLHHDAYVRLADDTDIKAALEAKQPNVSLADAGAAPVEA